MNSQEESVKMAIRVILSDKKACQTNIRYVVDYAKKGLKMEGQELKVQALYILSNIAFWKHPKAKEIRAILRDFS